MELKILIVFSLVFWRISNSPIVAQITTPCSPTVISTVTPCMSFLTSSSGNGNSPTQDCCTSLRSLTGTGLDCLCLILTASVPFTIPINRTLAVSLPRACSMPGVPLQCRASASPLPAPGPISLGPTLTPPASTTPKDSVVPAPALSPESDTTPLLTPPSPTVDNGGSRSALTPPSAASASIASSLMLFAFCLTLLKFF